MKGVGTTATTEKWSSAQFTAEAGQGAITKVSVSVLRASTTLGWEMGFGGVAPLTYANVIRVNDAPFGVIAKNFDPVNQQYNFGTITTLKTYDVGALGQILITGYQLPARGHADLKTRLKIEYHDGSSTIIENATDQTKEGGLQAVADAIHGDAQTGQGAINGGKRVRKVAFEVQNISVDTNRTIDIGVFRVRGFMHSAMTGGLSITP